MSDNIYTISNLYENRKIVRPVMYKHFVCPEYGIDAETGDLWSFRCKNTHKLIKARIGADGYRRVNIECDSFPSRMWSYQKGKPKRERRMKTIQLHILVAHTLIDIPRPERVSQEDWDKTPESVKAAVKEGYRINHIDHNPLNYHPSNLEYVTASGNTQAMVANKPEVYGVQDFGETTERYTR